jgi:hypothetical protein
MAGKKLKASFERKAERPKQKAFLLLDFNAFCFQLYAFG